MDTLYWALEYAKVLMIYMFLMFVWPSVVFRKYLKGKSKTFHFSFCVTVQVVLINTVVLGLGLLHILNRWTMILVFYGVFLFSVLRGRKFRGEGVHQFHKLVHGTKGPKLFLIQNIRKFKVWIKKWFHKALDYTKGHRIEYITLAIVVVFGMMYFTYGAFVDHSYGFGDMYTHHSWIYGLIQGKIFSSGIYPEAMHCFIYSMYALFGVRVYSVLLFLAGIHVSVLLVSVYCMLKEVFRSRYGGIFALALFLTVDVLCIDEVFSMSRLQWTLPQEFGFYTQFLCVLYLIRYLRGERVDKKENGKRKWIVWDENLFLFMMSLAASLAIHFYVTIMAFFLCASFAVFALHRIFRKGNFRSLVAAVVGGVMIAVIPMGLALASGIEFQGSIGWAVNVINGTDEQEFGTQPETSDTQTSSESDEGAKEQMQASETTQSSSEGSGKEQKPTLSTTQKIQRVAARIRNTMIEKANTLNDAGYLTLYQAERTRWILLLTAVAAGLGVLCSLVTACVRKKLPIEGYLGITLASVVFMILYASTALGLPSLIARSRLCSMEQMLILSVVVVPVDFLFFLLGKTAVRKVLPIVSLLGIGGVYAMVQYADMYHGFLYNELTRYNAAVSVTNELMEKFPENTYTIVSTTDEIYQVILDGRHEEALNFLRQMEKAMYSIPTEYLAFYVEKRPIKYAQYHFLTGPGWLAEEKYTQFYAPSYISEGNQLRKSTISEAMSRRPLMRFAKESDVYSDVTSRAIVESKMYYWCEQYRKSFPHEMSVYYEDENFVCYIMKQNTSRLFSLEGL